MNQRRILTLALATVFVMGGAGCDEDYQRFDEIGPVTPRDPVGADAWVLDVNVDGTSAAYSVEEMPTGTTTAPTVLGAGQIVRGGSLVMAVTVDDTADQVLVGVGNADFGYFMIDLASMSPASLEMQAGRAEARAAKLSAAGATSPDLARVAARAPREVWVNLTSAPDYTGVGFTIRVATVTGGVVSAARNHVVSVNSVAAGSSELQVSLNWVHPVDMDLHVLAPGDDLIFFANKVGAQGGQLDLDSNPACFLDYIQNENITWRTTAPVAGEYVVRVDLWSACEVAENMPYIVTVRRGDQVSTYEGSFIAADESSAAREITRITIE